MAERLKARAWKVRVPQKGTVGSNPTLSATHASTLSYVAAETRGSREGIRRFRRFAARRCPSCAVGDPPIRRLSTDTLRRNEFLRVHCSFAAAVALAAFAVHSASATVTLDVKAFTNMQV